MFQESQSSQRFRPETERRKRVTGSRPPKAPGNLVGSESTKDRDQNTFLSSPRRIPNPFPGCAQRVALLTQPRPTAARRFLAAAGAPRSLSRRPAGDEGGAAPSRGRPGSGTAAPSAHPEAAAARRAPRECSARRAAGREARRGREGGSRREPPPLAARVPAGRMGRFEPGSREGPAPSFLLP